jgi:hypothetical protein
VGYVNPRATGIHSYAREVISRDTHGYRSDDGICGRVDYGDMTGGGVMGYIDPRAIRAYGNADGEEGCQGYGSDHRIGGRVNDGDRATGVIRHIHS